MKATNRLFTLLILGCLVLGIPATGLAKTITVNSLKDPSDGRHCTLHDAIIAANTGSVTNGCPGGSGKDTINFSLSGTIATTAALPAISKTLTIDGSGQLITIDGGGTHGILSVPDGANVTLNQLTISNGNNSKGGVDHSGGSLTVTNCTFSNNNGSLGGGISSVPSASGNIMSTTVSNSVFSGNTGPFGGAISSFDETALMKLSVLPIAPSPTIQPSAVAGALLSLRPKPVPA
jgi:hypothetical protein